VEGDMPVVETDYISRAILASRFMDVDGVEVAEQLAREWGKIKTAQTIGALEDAEQKLAELARGCAIAAYALRWQLERLGN
jgi:hypothetical protein